VKNIGVQRGSSKMGNGPEKQFMDLGRVLKEKAGH